jgi:hypothetical protein
VSTPRKPPRLDKVDWQHVSALFLGVMESSHDLPLALRAAVTHVMTGKAPKPKREQPLRSARARGRAATVVSAVCQAMNLEPDKLLSRHVVPELTFARRCCWWILRFRHGWSTVDIGLAFSRDHSTVVTGLQDLQIEFQKDATLRGRLEDIGRRVRAPAALTSVPRAA